MWLRHTDPVHFGGALDAGNATLNLLTVDVAVPSATKKIRLSEFQIGNDFGIESLSHIGVVGIASVNGTQVLEPIYGETSTAIRGCWRDCARSWRGHAVQTSRASRPRRL